MPTDIEKLSADQLEKLAVDDRRRGAQAKALLAQLRKSADAVTRSGEVVTEFSRKNPEA